MKFKLYPDNCGGVAYVEEGEKGVFCWYCKKEITNKTLTKEAAYFCPDRYCSPGDSRVIHRYCLVCPRAKVHEPAVCDTTCTFSHERGQHWRSNTVQHEDIPVKKIARLEEAESEA